MNLEKIEAYSSLIRKYILLNPSTQPNEVFDHLLTLYVQGEKKIVPTYFHQVGKTYTKDLIELQAALKNPDARFLHLLENFLSNKKLKRDGDTLCLLLAYFSYFQELYTDRIQSYPSIIEKVLIPLKVYKDTSNNSDITQIIKMLDDKDIKIVLIAIEQLYAYPIPAKKQPLIIEKLVAILKQPEKVDALKKESITRNHGEKNEMEILTCLKSMRLANENKVFLIKELSNLANTGHFKTEIDDLTNIIKSNENLADIKMQNSPNPIPPIENYISELRIFIKQFHTHAPKINAKGELQGNAKTYVHESSLKRILLILDKFATEPTSFKTIMPDIIKLKVTIDSIVAIDKDLERKTYLKGFLHRLDNQLALYSTKQKVASKFKERGLPADVVKIIMNKT